MTTIVALGCGLVGEFVVQRLVDDGHSVVAVDLHLPDSIKKNTQIKSIEGDAKEYISTLKDLTGIEISLLSTSPEREDTILFNDPFI